MMFRLPILPKNGLSNHNLSSNDNGNGNYLAVAANIDDFDIDWTMDDLPANPTVEASPDTLAKRRI